MRSARAKGLAKAGWMVAVLACLLPCAEASGPRYVTGPPFFTGPAGCGGGLEAGKPDVFYRSGRPERDGESPGGGCAGGGGGGRLEPSGGEHITLARGGALGEHVSGQNTYTGRDRDDVSGGRDEHERGCDPDRGDL